uniref:Uncharacterized protein n=1 Tax=Amphilophus citrinellus TaxID=61819 RepID=A0A3Q0SG68_AMPCI
LKLEKKEHTWPRVFVGLGGLLMAWASWGFLCLPLASDGQSCGIGKYISRHKHIHPHNNDTKWLVCVTMLLLLFCFPHTIFNFANIVDILSLTSDELFGLLTCTLSCFFFLFSPLFSPSSFSLPFSFLSFLFSFS